MVDKPTGRVRSTGSSSPGRGSPGSGGLIALVNGGLAGIGGVYATTHSVTITVIAGVVALALALMVVLFQGR
jgi:hypothetical protein